MNRPTRKRLALAALLCALALPNVGGLSALTTLSGTLNLYNNSALTNVGGLSALITLSGTLNLSQCALDSAAVDALCNTLAATVTTGGGVVVLQQAIAAPPTSASAAARAYLTGLGITITTD